MAGGTFKAHNKVRPGAYINFKAVSLPQSRLGSRGIVTMPVALNWGDEITEVYSTDLVDGKSLAKLGFVAADEESQVVREALKNAYKAIIYRLDAEGSKATATLTNLVATAKHAGVLGNDLSVEVKANGELFDVITSLDDIERDRQTVDKIADLNANDWVVFSGTGNLVVTTDTDLEGGLNGTVNSDSYARYFDLMKAYNWNTMGIPQDSAAANTAAIAAIKEMREDFGKKVQVVLYDATANYEGVISVKQGYKTEHETVSPILFVAYMAGLTAGSNVNVSNTYHVIEGATSIEYPTGTDPYDYDDIVELLRAGKIVLSTRQDGAVVIEQDINTLHAYEPGVTNSLFSKNRVIRTLDEINNSVSLLFETSYIGKVDNDADGRNIFKAGLISYLNELQAISAIKNFNSQSDIQIYAGEAIDSIVVDLAIQPVDSMEKLYLTVVVG